MPDIRMSSSHLPSNTPWGRVTVSAFPPGIRSPWLVYRLLRKLVVAAVGGSVVLVGAVMVFTPGPALVVIPFGLAILATEFVWAKRVLEHARMRAMEAVRAVRGSIPPGEVSSPKPGATGSPEASRAV